MKELFCFLVGLSLIAAAMFPAGEAVAEEDIYLHQIPRVNGISFDPVDPDTVLVATHHGVFSVVPDGLAVWISADAGALLELVRHPRLPSTLLASGYRSETEKLGVLRSDDGGRTWSRVAEGDGGPVAFSAMAISHDAPAIVYGVDEDLQVSRDGGRTWSKVGKTPGQVFDIAVSKTSPDTIYLATLQGLFRSFDGGATWIAAHSEKRPATMVHVASNGVVHAFVYGLGLVSSADAQALNWQTIATDFVDRALMDFTIHPQKPEILLGVADTGAVMISRDRGRTWGSFEGQLHATADRIEAGRKLFEENCQACHGVNGVGERPDDMYATDENGLYVAPPLDDSAHGWHHSDDQLIETILDGSPRNERMAAWKELDISREDAEDIVAYIKSLWSFRSLACQGPRHMSCMQ